MRTASGDAWADDAFWHVRALEELESRGEADQRGAAAAAAAAGAAVILVPESLGPLNRLKRALGTEDEGGDQGPVFSYIPLDGYGSQPFDAFAATEGLLDSIGDFDIGGVDAGVSAVDSALDSVSGSIDAGVSRRRRGRWGRLRRRGWRRRRRRRGPAPVRACHSGAVRSGS